MVTPQAVRRRWRKLLRDGVARGALPFSFGASSHYRGFKRIWTNRVPVSFNEKLQYKLIYDRRPLVRIYADKFAVREYVARIAPELKLPQLLASCDDANSAVEMIPKQRWVMKASHGAGMVLISEPHGPTHPDLVRKLARRWLATDYSLVYWEWQYHRLPRRILFEEFIGTDEQPPADYKFYVIHQKVRLITVDEGRFTDHTRNLFYPDWTPIASRKGHAPVSAKIPERPVTLERMKALAEKLSCDTDFLRVDLYQVGHDIYFGELTHSPAAGDMDFEDPKLDREIGAFWKLPRTFA
ncbi:MAG TPA: ATP-grasp fold amidoligase family protein [Opitutaceae bacterium]